MNHTQPQKRNHGHLSSDAFSSIIPILLFLLTAWGIGRTFYREGPVAGGIATIAWPYAWYKGVSFLWEEPKWKEKYRAKTKQLAIIVGQSSNPDPEYQLRAEEYKDDLRKWIKSLPAEEKIKLEHASRVFGDATVAYWNRFLFEGVNGTKYPHPETLPEIEIKVSQFSAIPAFDQTWNEMLKAAQADPIENIQPMPAAEVQRTFDIARQKIDATISDLFTVRD